MDLAGHWIFRKVGKRNLYTKGLSPESRPQADVKNDFKCVLSITDFKMLLS